MRARLSWAPSRVVWQRESAVRAKKWKGVRGCARLPGDSWQQFFVPHDTMPRCRAPQGMDRARATNKGRERNTAHVPLASEGNRVAMKRRRLLPLRAVAVLCFFVAALGFLERCRFLPTIRTTASAAQSDRRAFVCITGQVSRLELDYKVRTLLNPIRAAGFIPDVALVLSESAANETYWTKPRHIIEGGHVPRFSSCEEAADNLRRLGVHVITEQPYTQSEHPVVRDEYLEMMKLKTPDREKKIQQRAQSNIRMLGGWSQCYKEMISSSEKYDFGVRIRDDHGFTRALDIPDVLSDLKPFTVMSTDCQIHSGMNDRFAIFSPDAAYDYFVGPLLYFYMGRLNETVRNTESLIKHAYLQANLTIMNSPKIRGLEKIQTNANGTSVVYVDDDSTKCIHKTGKRSTT